MDYLWKYDGTDNPYKDNMTSFFKWQWDKMRTDNSLITLY